MSIKMTLSGPNLIRAALQSPCVRLKEIRTNHYYYEKLSLSQYKQYCPIHLIDKKNHHSGRDQIEATLYFEPYTSFDKEAFSQYKTVLFLDHLSDPQNVGNAIRHSFGFFVDAIVLPVHKSAPINDLVARGSAGALFQIPIYHIQAVGSFLKQAKEAGFGLIGTALEGAEPFTTQHFWAKSLIAIGHEGKGLRESTKKLCDSLVKIEHHRELQSLNAATTATLLCYERYKSL